MEVSDLRKINKDRLTAFLKHLEQKNSNEMFEKCLVSCNFNKILTSGFFLFVSIVCFLFE